MSGWIKCKDRLPEINPRMCRSEEVLMYTPREGEPMQAILWNIQGRTHWSAYGELYKLDDVTHWMPMPEPPTMED